MTGNNTLSFVAKKKIIWLYFDKIKYDNGIFQIVYIVFDSDISIIFSCTSAKFLSCRHLAVHQLALQQRIYAFHLLLHFSKE